MQTIPFFKMSGSGNDFIIIDHRVPLLINADLSVLIPKICQRKQSVGADGFILIEPSDRVDFKWRFFNSDGSLAEMCGNGARCAARFAYLNNIAGPEMSFETEAGVIAAAVTGEQVKIQMTDPFDMQLGRQIDLSNDSMVLSVVNTGVPHAVLWVDDLGAAAVVEMGRKIRFHQAFAPAGTNVNFAALQGERLIAIRTYERGVEDETLACGTGAVASALMAAAEKGLASPVHVHTRSGGVLTIYFQRDGQEFSQVFLEGDARVVYQGEMWADAWNW
jgi:diaminopimelate epimerase